MSDTARAKRPAIRPMTAATIANGGELLEPALVKEIRAADDTVLYKHERRVVRRVMPDSVAATMRRLLASVVDSGTATGATRLVTKAEVDQLLGFAVQLANTRHGDAYLFGGSYATVAPFALDRRRCRPIVDSLFHRYLFLFTYISLRIRA